MPRHLQNAARTHLLAMAPATRVWAAPTPGGRTYSGGALFYLPADNGIGAGYFGVRLMSRALV